jgi:hypothetical protein
MIQNVNEMKLKHLIQVCKETGNNKKLAVVSFILVSNQVDEIGITLGVHKRRKASGEKIFEYMELINQVFEKSLAINIFKEIQIDNVRSCEVLFLRNKGDIPKHNIKDMFVVYFELRKLDVPNLYKDIRNGMRDSSQLGLYSFLSSGSTRIQKKSDTMQPLLIQKLKESAHALKSDLDTEFNAEKLEKLIHLQSIKNSIEKKGKKGVSIQGPLKQNILYQKSIEGIYKYFLIGLIILTISLGFLISIEISYFPTDLGSLSSWSLLFFGTTIFLVIIYIRQFRKEGI